jgi:formylglycine-generating enzyme required for sulfatase activity
MRSIAVVFIFAILAWEISAYGEETVIESAGLYTRAKKLIDSRPPDYEQALRLFKLVYKLDSTQHKALANVGNCQRELGQYAEAVETYRVYLKHYKNGMRPTNREIETRIAKLESDLGTLELMIQTPDVDVWIDDVMREKSSVKSLRIRSGTHGLKVKRAGCSDYDADFEIIPGRTKRLDVQGCPASSLTNNFVLIPSGSFNMGSPSGELGRDSDETQHYVTIRRPFEIQVTEVTQDQFSKVMGYNNSHFTNCGSNCPVESVSWNEVAEYCNRLSSKAGVDQCYSCSGSGQQVQCSPSSRYQIPEDCPGYRLPTEAEWEYAARGSGVNRSKATYNGDLDNAHLGCEPDNNISGPIGWFCGNAGSTTHPVRGKRPNDYGLYDMLGNVWEWTHDLYSSGGSYRVFRGGGWGSDARRCRAANRGRDSSGYRLNDLGFRPARSRP